MGGFIKRLETKELTKKQIVDAIYDQCEKEDFWIDIETVLRILGFTEE